MSDPFADKSTVDEIRRRFDADVERFRILIQGRPPFSMPRFCWSWSAGPPPKSLRKQRDSRHWLRGRQLHLKLLGGLRPPK